MARPFGGVVFGHFGDRIGRKKILVLSLLMMGCGTVAIGLLPTYDQVGIIAPALLVLARLVQGFAVGGEWGGAVLMAVEHAPPGRRAFYGSWPQAGVPAGMVLSTAAFFLVGQLPEEQFQAWGWRLPFLASVALLAVGLYIRVQVVESPDFRSVRESKSLSAFPLAEVLRGARRPLVVGICTQAAAFVPFYLVAVFVLSYGPQHLGISRDVILLSIIAAFVLDLFTIPAAAVLADRFGRRRMLLAGSVYMAAIAFPYFWLFDSGSPWLILIAMVLAIPIGHAVTYSAVAGYLAELFPANCATPGHR
ncbi:MFS transporter [Qaidamihabitans albus]|uniref:MFS transporter n=1 Tax=Qaidamihabitans albus TaxID=2795733 RepID=UPI0018F1D755|nr:MFS transporter [Qaidamihabitans albus]